MLDCPDKVVIAQVDDKGFLLSGSLTGTSSLLITSQETFGVSQTLILTVKVSWRTAAWKVKSLSLALLLYYLCVSVTHFNSYSLIVTSSDGSWNSSWCCLYSYWPRFPLHRSGVACVLRALQYQSCPPHAHQREPESPPPGSSAHLHCPFPRQHRGGPAQLQLPAHLFHKQVCHHTISRLLNTQAPFGAPRFWNYDPHSCEERQTTKASVGAVCWSPINLNCLPSSTPKEYMYSFRTFFLSVISIYLCDMVFWHPCQHFLHLCCDGL